MKGRKLGSRNLSKREAMNTFLDDSGDELDDM
jgi:hypothetical protein